MIVIIRALLGRVSAAMAVACIGCGYALSASGDLPVREGPAIETTPGVPHEQIGVQPVPELSAELLRRVALLPRLDIRPTVIGMFGAKGFWLLEDKSLARPEVIFHAREFAHLHTDGSLHASLPPKRAFEAIANGWGVRHPSAQYHARLEGFVMLFTPQTKAELDVVFGLVVDGYNFVVGSDLRAEDYK